METRHWFFRTSYLSLSLLVAQSSINAADIPTMGKFVVQAIQVIGFGAGAFYRASGGKWGAPPLTGDPQSSSGGTVAGMPMPTVSPIANAPDHGGKGKSSERKPSQSKSDREAEYALACWKEEIKKFDTAEIDKQIKQAEDIVKHSEGSKCYYKGKALKEVKDSIDFWNTHIEQLKDEKSARAEAKAQQAQYDKSRADLAAKKAELSQKTTTVSASTAVLITQTAPVTDSTEPLMKAKEDKPQPFRKNDGADSKKDMNDNEPPHETGRELNFNDKPNQGPGAHAWRPKVGHYGQKTIEAMQEIQDAVTKGTFRGVKDGKFQYDWICPKTGKQVWVETIDNTVQNCGFNAPGEHWILNESGFLQHPNKFVGPSKGLLKGVTAVGGSVAFSSDYLAQTQEDIQNDAKKAALENKFGDIVHADPLMSNVYTGHSEKTLKPNESVGESTMKAERASRAAAEDPFGYGNFTNNTMGNLVKSDSDGRIDYKNVTSGLVRNMEPKTTDVKKIMNDVVIKSMKTDKESIKKAMDSKPKHVKMPKLTSERHTKAYVNSIKNRWKPKKD